jgi:large subunit ribosomal protein L29
MKTRELRERTLEELEELYDDLREELFKLRAQRAVSQLEKSHRVQEVRRTIARVLTILKDRGYSHV